MGIYKSLFMADDKTVINLPALASYSHLEPPAPIDSDSLRAEEMKFHKETALLLCLLRAASA